MNIYPFIAYATAKFQAIPKRLLTLPLLLSILLIFCSWYDVSAILQREWMDVHIRGQGVTGIALYIFVVSGVTACGVPRQICALLGGYVFGIVEGTLLVTCGTALGCLLTFSYARFLGGKWLEMTFSQRFQKVNTFLRQSPFFLTVCVRIIPLGSNFLTNIAAGVSGLPALPFLSGSFVGFTVQNAIFATLGSGMQLHASLQRGIGAALYVISLGLGILLYRRYKALNATR